MAHRFLVKDIALQAGLGTATVDRVLNRRGNVRQQTIDRVQRAIVELEAQRQQLAMTGRKLIVDLVVEAPQSFLDTLDAALAEELPLMQPAVFRVRRALRARFPVAGMEETLRRIARRGSDGVILMAPEAEPLAQAIDTLEAGGIPVVTLATDLPESRRSAYVGLDNGRAGATAAWFVKTCLPHVAAPEILVTIRNDRFRGEEDREAGFRAALDAYLPNARIAVLVEGKDRPGFISRLRAQRPPPAAVYSIGGSNRVLLDTLPERPAVFIAHDLDPENRALLGAGRIDILLYHDLREDIRNACRVITGRHLSRRVPSPPRNAALRILVPPIFAP